MDQIKVGRFIAECRKEKKLTQAQLAEKLCITDKAISKWERGITMPDSSIMLGLCEILGISVNELLRGEKINAEDDHKKTEELLLEMTRKEEAARKKLHINAWTFKIVMFILSCGMGAISAIIFSYLKFGYIELEVDRLIFTIMLYIALFLIVVILIGAGITVKMETDSGRFICKNCQHEFNPTFKAAFFAFVSGTPKNYKSYLKCPKCGKKTWAKKALPK